MILNTIVLALSLLTVSVSGSSIKGRSEEYSSKGGRQLVGPAAVGYQLRPYNYEQQQHQEASYATKGHEVRRTDEASQAAPVEQAKLATDSEHAYQAQQREETKSERQQFYEAQPQLRTEEQTRLVQYAEQTRLDDSSVQQRQQVAAEAPKYEAPKYEARPQVREEAQSVSVVATSAAVPVVAAAAKGVVYSSKTTEERRDEQVQYASAAAAAAQPEHRKLAVEEVQRVEEVKGQRAYGEESAKASQVSKAAEAATVQRIEEQKFEQQEQQQAVELTKQEHYEQRRFEEQTEQRSDEQVVQVREEAVKGGLRAAGAEAEPYAFDYSVEGSSRRETGDQYGVVRGQYTIQNPDGSQRVVDYVADRDGFRAQVQSNEFGSEAQQAAAQQVAQQQVVQRSSQQPQQASADFARLDTKTVVYAPAPVPVAPVVAAAPAVAIKSVPQPIVQVVAAAPAPAVVPEVIRAKASYSETSQQSASGAGPYKAASVESTSYQDEQRVYSTHELAPTAYKGRQVLVSNADSGYRSPKSAFRSAELRAAPEEPLLARASSFESATAHRPVVHHSHAAPAPAAVVRHVVPASSVVPVVRHHLPAVPVAPGRRDRHPHPQHQHYRHHSSHQQQPSSVVPVSVSRAQLQHDRYPPALRRHDLAALNPRVSFYANGNNNFDDEQPAGFEHPAEPIL